MIKTTLKTTLATLSVAALALASSAANATVYSYDITNPPGSDGAGNIHTFSTSYDDVNETLTFSSTIQDPLGNYADGFWLVLSDGPNPKDDANEYAIFYGDGNTGNIAAYVYNGANSASSWTNPGEFIEGFSGALNYTTTATEATFDFSIDVSFINSYVPTTPAPSGNDWDGASFADQIGIWYHPVIFNNTGANFNSDGSLSSFGYSSNGWYDTKDQTTTSVSEPGIIALMLMGIAGVIAARRRA